MTAKEYAQKHGIKYTERDDGSITIRYRMRKTTADQDDFFDRVLRYAKGVEKRLPNHEYVADTRNWNFKHYPLLKIKMTFKPKEERE